MVKKVRFDDNEHEHLTPPNKHGTKLKSALKQNVTFVASQTQVDQSDYLVEPNIMFASILPQNNVEDIYNSRDYTMNYDKLIVTQGTCPELKQAIQLLRTPQLLWPEHVTALDDHTDFYLNNCTLKNDILVLQTDEMDKVILPESYRADMLLKAHKPTQNNAHRSYRDVRQALKSFTGKTLTAIHGRARIFACIVKISRIL